MNKKIKYCGFIGIVGKPNVGKSTILNKLIGYKISITSNKRGTTIKNIIGIKNDNKYQLIYIDTPGIQNKKNILNIKNKFIIEKKIKLIIFIINKNKWDNLDEIIFKEIKKFFIPIILVINKIDFMHHKIQLLPFINKIKNKYKFIEIIPVSAKNGDNIDVLSQKIKDNIPPSKHIFLKKYKTNVSDQFIISEIIREKFIRNCNQEIPYFIKVQINLYRINILGIYDIFAYIIVNNIRHKKIIIGKNGNKIKMCRKKAIKDIELYLSKKINLKLLVKIKS